MNIEYHKYWSAALNQNMEFKVYGHGGKPVLIFPTQGGRFFEFEDFGMIREVSWFIDEGHYQLFTVDSVDNQSWANWNASPAERARRHQQYDRYIAEEMVPYISSRCGQDAKLLAAGVSLGGYHAGNFFFRHPDLVDSLISLSGLFQLSMFIGDYVDDNVYFNSPLMFLPNLSDPWYLERYKTSKIIICAGQGAGEDVGLVDLHRLKAILQAKDIPSWIDVWGPDVNHDWPWWRKQLPYFLGKLLEG